MTEVKFYMLVEGEDSLYLALYDSEKNLISSYSNLNQNDINNYIENLENEKEFFISWEEEKNSDYLKLDEKLISYLLGKDNFVNADFEIIEKKEVENLALFIRNNKEIEDRLDIYIEINDNLLTKNNIVGNYIYSQGTFYKVDIPKIQVVNPVGSGDSTVAGISSALSHREDDVSLLKKANVLGMLNAQEKMTGHVNVENYDGLYNQITVKEV